MSAPVLTEADLDRTYELADNIDYWDNQPTTNALRADALALVAALRECRRVLALVNAYTVADAYVTQAEIDAALGRKP